MITNSEAMALAAKRLGIGPDQIGIEEFDLGFVAWHALPAHTDRSKPPQTIGGSLLVIDKETGQITTWPRIDPEAVAEQYRRMKRGG